MMETLRQHAPSPAKKREVAIQLDAGVWTGKLPHIWTYFGYDECNWTTSPNGKRLLDKIRLLAERPYYVRAHFLLCTGNGLGIPKFGSTNVYTEDQDGSPVYDFRLFDEIFDAWVSRGIRPFVELGFTPLDLVPETDEPYQAVQGSWAYPPRDYRKWRDLCYEVVRHCLDRYGEHEVENWYWELWNEPDIFYWKGTPEEYCTLYDHTVDGVKAAFPKAKVGGPATTHHGLDFFRAFLDHVTKGTNAVTGQKGTAIDFLSFHVKGGGLRPERRPPKQLMSRKQMVTSIRQFLETIDRYPELSGLEVHLSECDPDGWAAGGTYDNPNFFWRNTEYYPTFMVSVFKHILDINRRADAEAGAEAGKGDAKRGNAGPVSKAKVTSALTWAFMFEGKRYFEGNRCLTTHNIDKPILNLFRMLSRVGEKRLALVSSGSQDPCRYDDEFGTGLPPEVDGLASMSGEGSVEVLLWSHHDDWDATDSSRVEVEVRNLPFDASAVRIRHHRIDKDHSNAYTEWKRQGSPQDPTETQLRVIHGREGLERLEPDQTMPIVDQRVRITLELPAHGISLLIITPAEAS